MFALVCGDVRDSSKNIRGVRCCPFNAVPMVDTAISCFRIDIKELQIIVEINGAGAEVTAEEGGMRSENRRDVYSTLLAQW